VKHTFCYEEVQLDMRLGSSEQDSYAGGKTCWKAVELGRYRREVDSINNLI
jgi:hypothetical protein